MTDQPPHKNSPGSEEILAELRDLGQNLKGALQAAWQSEKRRRVQKEIEAALTDLSAQLSQAARDFTDSPTGQTIKADVEDFNRRLRSGEVESKILNEVLEALRTVNQELKRAMQHQSGTEESKIEEEPPSTV